MKHISNYLEKKMSKAKQSVKINDLINYITSGNSNIPEVFYDNEKEIKKIVNYLFEWFWSYPKFIIYLNQFNSLYDRSIEENPIEFLKFMNQLCTENKISKYHLKSHFFNYFQELNRIKTLEDEAIKEKKQFIDYLAEIKLKTILGKEIKIKKAKKIDKKELNDKKEKIKSMLEQHQQQEIQKHKNIDINSMYLKELNDEIIDQLQLTLFDVFLDENRNNLIYIFIDKNYEKKYYIEPYYIDVLVSKETTIFKNDYLKPIDNSFIKYRLFNYWDAMNLKKAINYNFENVKNYKDF
jgi:hypothetical protein